MHFALLISSYRFKQSLQWTYCNFLGMSTFNWHLILGKPTHDHLGNNEKTDFGQNQLPTYEETQISISPHFNNGSVNDKPAPFVEQVTLVKSGSDGLRFRWSCLADKKTGAKKIFVLDFRQEESAKGMSHPHSLKLASHQFYKTFYIVLANSGGQFSGLRELFVMITIQNKIFFGMTCPYKVFFQKKKFFARNKSSHN